MHSHEHQVLLVEDDPHLAAAVSTWLGEDDLEVTWAATGEEGLTFADQARWSCVISDIELPGLSGLELARQLKRKPEGPPLLMITAHQSVEYAVEALRNRADDFVTKPLDLADLRQRTVRLIENHEGQRPGQTVLAIGAHPDDVEIGCGGILSKHRAAGDAVTILTLTRGARGGPAEQRCAESREAAKVLDCELVHHDLHDTMVEEGTQTISLIEDAIRRYQVDVIYTHTCHDNHQDHRNVHRATLVAARPVPNVFCYQSPSSTVAFCPTRFVEIGEQLEHKLEALDAYRTQVSTRRYLTEDLIRSTAVYWGRYGGYGAVEPLEVIRSCA